MPTTDVKHLKLLLQLKQHQLNWLLEITSAINSNFSADQLYKIYEFILHSRLKIDKLALFIEDDGWKCKFAYGTDNHFTTDDFESKIASVIPLFQNNKNAIVTAIDGFEVVVPVFHKEESVAFAFLGKHNSAEYNFEYDIIPFVQTITNVIVMAIENKKLAKKQVQQQLMKREMELAAQMQKMLFPPTLPKNEKVDLTATYIPHHEVGGDYYDFISINANEFAVCMADVSGKGIPAALLMSNFQANLRAHLPYTNNLKVLITLLNKKVMQSAKGEKFITFFIGKYNYSTKEFTYINAGHNAPMLLINDKISLLEAGTIGLGMFEELPFLNEEKFKISAPSTLFCYTDGITDLENESEQIFGTERLKEFFSKHHREDSPQQFHQLLKDELYAYKGVCPFIDDITLLSCKFK